MIRPRHATVQSIFCICKRSNVMVSGKQRELYGVGFACLIYLLREEHPYLLPHGYRLSRLAKRTLRNTKPYTLLIIGTSFI